MKILITGAKGFIGQYLVREFQSNGYDVVGIDFQDGDLREEGVIDSIVEEVKPDIVIHLAAQVGILFNEIWPYHSISSNVVMTLRVAYACNKFNIPLCHTSTSEVYGDVGDVVVDEETPLAGRPTGIYALTKRWSEDIVKRYAPRGLIIIRPDMPYGIGVPPGKGRRAMDNMLWQAYHKKPITVHRGAVRSWTWIDDVVRAWRMVIESGIPGIYNIGRDDDEHTMFWIAQKACQIAGVSEDLIQIVEPPSDRTVTKRISTKKLQSLGWKPEMDIDTGMRLLFDWIKQFPWKE